jgi:hypothetical protein
MLSWCIYAVSWFLQAIDAGCTLSEHCLPGWEAILVAFTLNTDPWWAVAFSVPSGLTNLVIIASVPIALGRFARARRALAWALASSTLLNLQWLNPGSARAGYYLWVLSFGLAALAAFRFAKRPSSVAIPGPAAA